MRNPTVIQECVSKKLFYKNNFVRNGIYVKEKVKKLVAAFETHYGTKQLIDNCLLLNTYAQW